MELARIKSLELVGPFADAWEQFVCRHELQDEDAKFCALFAHVRCVVAFARDLEIPEKGLVELCRLIKRSQEEALGNGPSIS